MEEKEIEKERGKADGAPKSFHGTFHTRPVLVRKTITTEAHYRAELGGGDGGPKDHQRTHR